MLMLNPTDKDVVCEALNLRVPPGSCVEVDDGYCAPRATFAGLAPQEPIIRLLCPQLIPQAEELWERWAANAPVVHIGPPPVTVDSLEADGVSPGVAALVAAGDAETAPIARRGRKPSAD